MPTLPGLDLDIFKYVTTLSKVWHDDLLVSVLRAIVRPHYRIYRLQCIYSIYIFAWWWSRCRSFQPTGTFAENNITLSQQKCFWLDNHFYWRSHETERQQTGVPQTPKQCLSIWCEFSWCLWGADPLSIQHILHIWPALDGVLRKYYYSSVNTDSWTH